MARVNLMVVEDEFIIAADLKDRVDRMGYRVSVQTDSGEDALRQIEGHSFDLILMDIVLNGRMDGIEAARAIREHSAIPIVFLTAYGSESIIEKAKLAEPFGYILKPFSDKELRAVIETALYKARVEQELKETNRKLAQTLSNAKKLSGLIPICASCKKIRNDRGYWEQVEAYIQTHSEAEFSHSLCPDCTEDAKTEALELGG